MSRPSWDRWETVRVECPECGTPVEHTAEWVDERDEDGERLVGWSIQPRTVQTCECDLSRTQVDALHDAALAKIVGVE